MSMMLRLWLCIAFIAVTAVAQNTMELQTAPPATVPPFIGQPPSSGQSPMPQSVPSVTLPGQAGAAAGPDGAPQAPPQDPNLEFVAVEALTTGQKTELSEELKPFSSILNKLNAGDTYHIVYKEAQKAPYSQETAWKLNDLYDAYVLPMEQTKEGAVRLDTRVAMNSNGRNLNALRAEGELPPNKTMVFRGLEGSNGSEMLLFLHIKNDDQEQQQQDSGDSENEPEDQEQQDQQDGQQGDAQEEGEQQDQQKPEDGEGEQQDEQQQDAKASEPNEPEGDSASASDAHEENIEALLKSLEETDQQQQAQARFGRKKFILPRSGEWW